MKTNQNVVHVFHAGLASQLSAMLRAMLAMRACHSGLRTVAKAAWAATWLRPQVCWLVCSLPSRQRSSLWFPHAMWCLHQHQVHPLIFFFMHFPFLGRCPLPVFVSLLFLLVGVVLLVRLFPVIPSTLFLASCFILILGSHGPLQVGCQLELASESGEFCLHGHNLVFIR